MRIGVRLAVRGRRDQRRALTDRTGMHGPGYKLKEYPGEIVFFVDDISSDSCEELKRDIEVSGLEWRESRYYTFTQEDIDSSELLLLINLEEVNQSQLKDLDIDLFLLEKDDGWDVMCSKRFAHLMDPWLSDVELHQYLSFFRMEVSRRCFLEPYREEGPANIPSFVRPKQICSFMVEDDGTGALYVSQEVYRRLHLLDLNLGVNAAAQPVILWDESIHTVKGSR